MRRFFRFSIRDLLWLTLVVAVALGWFVREQQYQALQAEAVKSQAKLDQARSRATKWRLAAGGLEHLVFCDGQTVKWDFSSSHVSIGAMRGSFVEPSVVVFDPILRAEE